MVRGLAVPVLAERDFGRLLVILRGPSDVPALREMRGELARDLARALTVSLLEPLARPQVKSRPLPEGETHVEHVLVQGMDERIAAGHRPVGPLGHPDRAQKLAAPRQGVTAAFRLLRADAARRPDRGRELRARHAADRQHRLLVRRQTFDLLLDHL